MSAVRTGEATAGSAFSRSASGLVRVAGSIDVFVYNIGLVSVGIAIALNQYYGPSLYPGAAIWVSTVLAAVGMLAAAATFYFWSVTFPRSGGVYVLLSRSTSPALAFVLSAVESVILMYYAALAASLIVTVGLSSLFGTVGVVSGNATLTGWAASTSSADGVFWLGTLVLLLAGGLLASGTRRYFTVQRVLFAVALIGTAITAAVLLFGSRATFAANLQELTNLEYDAVIATAAENGYVTQPFDLGTTVMFLVFPLLPLLGAIQSVGLGGEIKQVRRAQLLGMLGAVAAAGVMIAVFAGLASRAFGDEFQGAIAFNSLSGTVDASTEGSLGVAPWFTVLAGLLSGNVLLTAIIMLTFVAWIWFWIPAEIAYTTRTMVAWSFDRVAPDRLGHVSRRLHTPVVAIGISTTISVVFMWLIAYRSIALLSLIEALLVVWGTALGAAVIFPRMRRQFFAASPAAAFRVGRVPLMSLTGALALAFFATAFVLLWRDENAAGPLVDPGAASFWIVLGTLVAGVAWYVIARRVRRRQGIDVDLAFRQIPIE